ncbi:hypothetical protein EG68_08496 [Paragonimus skrjabini miyazakii]|uniref:Uncharacterized protein n=1 Tax=Paragonimus skrjabini miyazakii TaxID=59628 RepID=A0A8S9YHP5_9TREM|nr:hypothetical protein EG68_08496 [Paragonimus skrjabini miyazakii]
MQCTNSPCTLATHRLALSVAAIEYLCKRPSIFDYKRITFGVASRMSNTGDLSPPTVKSMRTQQVFLDDRGEFRSSLRRPPIFHPGDDFKGWEFAVTNDLANVPARSMGPYILSCFSKEAARIFRTTGV